MSLRAGAARQNVGVLEVSMAILKQAMNYLPDLRWWWERPKLEIMQAKNKLGNERPWWNNIFSLPGSREGNSLLTETDIVYLPKGIHPRFAWFLAMGLKNAIETVLTLFADWGNWVLRRHCNVIKELLRNTCARNAWIVFFTRWSCSVNSSRDLGVTLHC